MMILRSNWSLVALIIIAVFLVSCAAPPPPTPAPTTAPIPTAPVPATAVPAAATTAPTATLQSTVAPTTAPTATSAPAATTAPTAAATSSPTVRAATATVAPTTAPTTASSSSSGSGKVDMNAILPPGKGQTLLLNNCTSCHSFVCAVKGQRTVDYWQTIKLGHRDRVGSMSDEDYNTLFTYLAENFNDKKPIPELPPALQDLGCSAQ